VGGLAAIGLVVLFLGAMDDDDSRLAATAQAPGTGRDYPAAVRENFTDACLGGGAADDYCSCALDAIEAEYTFREYLDLEREYARTGEFPPEMFEAVERSC